MGNNLPMLIIWNLFAGNCGLDGIVDNEEKSDEGTNEGIVKGHF